jgi:hypothetical protein
MENTFLICGLPRSRTLWFSHFLSVPDVSVCTHEACEFAASAAEFWHNATCFSSDAGVPVYGDSDSATLFVLPALLAERPLTRVVWIDRRPDEVIASMAAAKIPHDLRSVQMMCRLRDAYKECFDCVVPYHHLVHMAVCRDVWQLVMPPEIPFDLARWKEFNYRRIAYGKDHPFPAKDYAKFYNWVALELAQPVWKEW